MAEDLLTSAVQFLQDPKVADAPLAKRIAFLESKGLSQDQVQIALQRAQDAKVGVAPPVPATSYTSYIPQQQLSPPPLPQRDWRDWFIMAVVSGGFSWALYFLAKRYVVPLIQPPTQSKLEEDKEEIAKQFDQVQEMLSILQTDAAAAKESAQKQQERLDTAMTEVETAVSDAREKSARRETDIRRLGLEIDQIREMIPKAIEGVKQAQNDSLNDLHNELKSLKTLLTNRLKAQPASFQATPRATEETAKTDPLSRLTAPRGNGIPAWQLAAGEDSTAAAPAPASTPAP
ncbi:peroxisomal membrane protein pex14 [Savitreella phatthalungensis]